MGNVFFGKSFALIPYQNFCIERILSVMGASGSGKSTLLHIIGSVDKPTGGKVTVDGTDISGLNQTQVQIAACKL